MIPHQPVFAVLQPDAISRRRPFPRPTLSAARYRLPLEVAALSALLRRHAEPGPFDRKMLPMPMPRLPPLLLRCESATPGAFPTDECSERIYRSSKATGPHASLQRSGNDASAR